MTFRFKILSLLPLGMGLLFIFPINLESAGKKDVPSVNNMGSPISEKVKTKQKIVIGFHGKPRTLTKIWLKKQVLFVSIKYSGGQEGRFTNQGLLKGTLRDGRSVSIKITEDFLGRHPGMIYDHLKALEHRAELLNYSKRELNKQFNLNQEFKKWKKDKEKEHQKEMERDINHRLDHLLVNTLSSTQISNIDNLKKKIEPKIRSHLIKQLKKNIKEQIPDANKKTLDRAITKKINSELERMVREEMERVIMTENIADSTEWKEVKEMIHRFLLSNKANIVAEVQAEYAIKRAKMAQRMKKRFEEDRTYYSKKKEKSIFKIVLNWFKELTS